jgi:serine/threonine protein kinase
MELQKLAELLKTAKYPEDVFGMPAPDTDAATHLRTAYRELVKIAYVDAYAAALKPLATTVFTSLQDWHVEAKRAVEAKTYGKRQRPTTKAGFTPVTVTSKKSTYNIYEKLSPFSIYNAYNCAWDEGGTNKVGRFFIVVDAKNNDLAEAEVKALKKLGASKNAKYFPTIHDSFVSIDKGTRRNILVTPSQDKLYSLAEIGKAHPDGIDPRDMAWMFNRLMEGLWYAHKEGIIHGGLNPDCILMDIENHGIQLCSWAFSVIDGGPAHIKGVVPGYRSHYPIEVINKLPPTP